MAAPSPWILDVTEAEFGALLERSQTVPVVLDFWAPWCGPCRTLTPLLSKLADEYAGAFVLAKVNTDEQPRLAQAFQIQSIPSVKLVSGGRLLDQFDGALPERELRRFLEGYLGVPGAVAEAEAPAVAGIPEDPLAQAEALAQDGKLNEAIAGLTALLARLQAEARPRAAPAAELLLAELLVESSDEQPDPRLDSERFERASRLAGGLEPASETQVRESLPRDAKKREAAPPVAWGVIESRRLRSLRGRLVLGPRSLLQIPPEAAPQAEKQLQVGRALALSGDFEPALEALVASVALDRQHAGGRAQLLMKAIFDILGPDEPLTGQYRRRLQTVLF